MYSVLKDFIEQIGELICIVGENDTVQNRRPKENSNLRRRKERSS